VLTTDEDHHNAIRVFWNKGTDKFIVIKNKIINRSLLNSIELCPRYIGREGCRVVKKSARRHKIFLSSRTVEFFFFLFLFILFVWNFQRESMMDEIKGVGKKRVGHDWADTRTTREWCGLQPTKMRLNLRNEIIL
jgi:hypothetical protein